MDLATGDISADMRVSATAANASTVRVQMSPGDSVVPTDVVELGGGDTLYAQAGDVDFETLRSACPVTLTLRRQRAGVVDPSWSSGSRFTLERVRTTQFNSYR